MSDKTNELKDLLTRILDSADGYKDAAEHASQQRHIDMFTELSDKRYQYALKVQDYLNRYGEKVELDGSFLASTHRFFMDLKDKFDDESDEALLGSIVTGESELMSCYRNAMEDAEYDPEILNELQKQYQEVNAHIDLIQAKKKAA